MRVKSAWSNSEASGAVLRVHTEFPLPLLQPVEYLPAVRFSAEPPGLGLGGLEGFGTDNAKLFLPL